TRALMTQVMQEIVAMAQAQHIALPADVIPRTLAELAQFPPGGTNSMQRDLMSGRPSELEALAGAVVRLGQALGVPTPVNTFLYHSLLPLDLQARALVVSAPYPAPRGGRPLAPVFPGTPAPLPSGAPDPPAFLSKDEGAPPSPATPAHLPRRMRPKHRCAPLQLSLWQREV